MYGGSKDVLVWIINGFEVVMCGVGDKLGICYMGDFGYIVLYENIHIFKLIILEI